MGLYVELDEFDAIRSLCVCRDDPKGTAPLACRARLSSNFPHTELLLSFHTETDPPIISNIWPKVFIKTFFFILQGKHVKI